MFVDGQGQQGQHPVGHRHVEVDALSGYGPGDQSGTHRGYGVQASGCAVGDRGPRKGRTPALIPARAVEVAADGQVVEVVAGPGRAGAGLAVAGGRAVDDAGVEDPYSLVSDTEPVDHPGPEAFKHHVRFACQLDEHLLTLGFF